MELKKERIIAGVIVILGLIMIAVLFLQAENNVSFERFYNESELDIREVVREGTITVDEKEYLEMDIVPKLMGITQVISYAQILYLGVLIIGIIVFVYYGIALIFNRFKSRKELIICMMVSIILDIFYLIVLFAFNLGMIWGDI